MANALAHYLKSEQLLKDADSWMDVAAVWTEGMPTDQRIARRTADIAAAAVHAQLAQVALTATDHAPAADLTPWRAALTRDNVYATLPCEDCAGRGDHYPHRDEGDECRTCHGNGTLTPAEYTAAGGAA